MATIIINIVVFEEFFSTLYLTRRVLCQYLVHCLFGCSTGNQCYIYWEHRWRGGLSAEISFTTPEVLDSWRCPPKQCLYIIHKDMDSTRTRAIKSHFHTASDAPSLRVDAAEGTISIISKETFSKEGTHKIQSKPRGNRRTAAMRPHTPWWVLVSWFPCAHFTSTGNGLKLTKDISDS
jgi:hypothetical protein